MHIWKRRDIGWEEIDERFTRWEVFHCRWFSLLLHQLVAVRPHPECHDHPWWFFALVLRGGYNEYTAATGWVWRKPGSLLYRPAQWAHNVTTTKRGMWSLVLTGPRSRQWGFRSCGIGDI